MPQKFIVRAPDRKNSGHPGTYRGGRFFPGGEDKTIEVLDQDNCPTLEEKVGNQTRRYLDPDRVGRKAWDLIAKDDTLSKRPFGAPLFADPAKASELDALKSELAEAKKAHVDLIAKLGELESANSELREQNAELAAKLGEATATLESLTAPSKPEGEAPKVDDLPKSKSKTVK